MKKLILIFTFFLLLICFSGCEEEEKPVDNFIYVVVEACTSVFIEDDVGDHGVKRTVGDGADGRIAIRGSCDIIASSLEGEFHQVHDGCLIIDDQYFSVPHGLRLITRGRTRGIVGL